MNFFKRAFFYLKTKISRSLLLVVIFSAILVFVLAGPTIKSAALQAIESAKKETGATATLQVNREAMFSQSEDSDGERPDPSSYQSTPISLETAEAIASLDNVAAVNFLSSTSAGAGDDIEPISSGDSEETTASEETSDQTAEDGMGGMPGGGGMSQEAGSSFGPGNAQGDFTISGVYYSALEDSFANETAEIVDGEAITDEDVDTNNVLIEAALAEANELTVGDTFTLSNPTDEETTYTVTIKGIYETSDTGSSMGMNFNFMNPANTIYTSYTFANTLKGEDYGAAIDSASYNLSDPSAMDTFVEEANGLIDTDTFAIQTNDQTYQQMLQPLNNVATFAQNIVWLVMIAGTIILALIVMLSIKERRYEVGVLLSLGESRFKVLAQFFIELVLVMACSLLIATAAGNPIGELVGNQLIAQQTEQSESQTTANDNGGPGGGMGGGMRGGQMSNPYASETATADTLEDLEINVEVSQIVTLAGLGLAICLLAILISSIGVMRLQPKEILTT